MEKELIKLLSQMEEHLGHCDSFGTNEEKMIEEIKRLKVELAKLTIHD